MVNKSMTKLSEIELNDISGGNFKADKFKDGFKMGVIIPAGWGAILSPLALEEPGSCENGKSAGYAAGRVVHLGALAVVVCGLVKLVKKIKG